MGRRQPLPQIRTVVQQCVPCYGKGTLDKDHEFWAYTVRQGYERAGLPQPTALTARFEARKLYEENGSRCPGCGGHGKVLVAWDPTTRQVLAIMHYDDRGRPPDVLEYLKKINATA
jgi:hypothetical protein